MTSFAWKPVSGSNDWFFAANWDGGTAPSVIPFTQDDATIASGTATISAGKTASVHSLKLSGYSVLNDNGGLVSNADIVIDGFAQIALAGGVLTAPDITADSGEYGSVVGYGTVNANIVGNTQLNASGGLLIFNGAITNAWAVNVSAGATLEINGAVINTTVTMGGGQSKLQLDHPESFAGVISNLLPSATIDLKGISATSVDLNGNVLTVHYGDAQSLVLNVDGGLLGNRVQYASDGSGGTNLSLTANGITWSSNPSSQDWFTAANWVGGVAPGSGDDVAINSVASNSVAFGIQIAANKTALSRNLYLNGQMVIYENGAIKVASDLHLSVGTYIQLTGSITASNIIGDGPNGGRIWGYGTINASISGYMDVAALGSGLVINGAVSSSYIGSSGGLLELNGPVTGTRLGYGGGGFYGPQPINPYHAGAFQLDRPDLFSGVFSYLPYGSFIHLMGQTLSWIEFNNNVLSVTTTNGKVETFNFEGDYSANTFDYHTDYLGGTIIQIASPTPNIQIIAPTVVLARGDADIALNFTSEAVVRCTVSLTATTGGTAVLGSDVSVSNFSQALNLEFTTVRSYTTDLGHVNGLGHSLVNETIHIDLAAPGYLFSNGQSTYHYSMTLIGVNTHQDYDGDGAGDVLWRDDSGLIGVWNSTAGGGTLSYTGLGTIHADWKIATTGDFDGDGRADVLWRNDNGLVGTWNSSAGGASYQTIGYVPDALWQVAGAGDFDGDGKADVLWRYNNGEVIYWSSKAGGGAGGYTDLGYVGPDWKIAAVADFDGDGKGDLLWRNDNGALVVWSSSHGVGAAGYQGVGNVGTYWTVAETADFSGDGAADILWRGQGGEVYLWKSHAGSTVSFDVAPVATVGTEWHIQGAQDLNGDGRADILWRNDNGDAASWLSQSDGGYQFHDYGVFANSWHIVTT